VFTGQTHEAFPAALEEISLARPRNKALVITGAGDSFVDQIDGPSLRAIFKPAVSGRRRGSRARKYSSVCSSCRLRCRGRQRACDRAFRVLLVTNIDIASERATYGDFPHTTFGLTGGDGLHDPPTRPEQPLGDREAGPDERERAERDTPAWPIGAQASSATRARRTPHRHSSRRARRRSPGATFRRCRFRCAETCGAVCRACAATACGR
jgi:hypothetical protein